MAKFEAHITMPKEADVVNLVKDGFGGWQYSCIDDDPVMGQKPYCYLTQYNSNPILLQKEMNTVCEMLEANYVPVLRTKIERIIFDSKTSVDEIKDMFSW